MRRHGLTIAWGALILVLLLLPAALFPSPDSRPLPAASDKVVHFLLFLVFALLLQRSLAEGGRLRRPWLAAFVFAALYGGATELLQLALTADRGAELGDLAADVLGAAAATLWR